MLIHALITLVIYAGSPITGNHAFPVAERIGVVDETREDYVRYRLPVAGSKVTAGQAEALIDASSDEVLRVLRGYDGYKEFLPFFTYSKSGALVEGATELRLKAKIIGGTVELDVRVKARETPLADGGTAIDLEFVRGNVERFDARFRVYPIGPNRTFLVFYLMIDPDLWFARNKTLSEYNWVNCGRAVRALRDQVLKGLVPVPSE